MVHHRIVVAYLEKDWAKVANRSKANSLDLLSNETKHQFNKSIFGGAPTPIPCLQEQMNDKEWKRKGKRFTLNRTN